MPPAAASEEIKVLAEDYLPPRQGPADPGRRLRLLNLRCMPPAAVSEEKWDVLGTLGAEPRRPRQEDCVPLHSLL